MAYSKDGNSLLTQVIDIPMGGGKDEKTHKHLFQAPFLAEGKNIEVDKTGSVQKREGIQRAADVPVGLYKGTVFSHPEGQLGVLGSPDYMSRPNNESAGVIKQPNDPAFSQYVSSNKTGIYPCNVEESSVTRSDEAILHVQTNVYGNKVLTVWCTQKDPVAIVNKKDAGSATNNAFYYSIRELDTGTVTTKPTPILFSNQPRYTHIAVVDAADPHWVVVAAPDLYPEVSWQKLVGAAISVNTETVTAVKDTPGIGWIDSNQVNIDRFVAFDMHCEPGSPVAYILAQHAVGSPHGSYLFSIDKTLTMVANNSVSATSEEPLHSGAVLHVTGQGVFTAVSNQFGIVGARPGDGETYLWRYDENTLAATTTGTKVFLQTVPALPFVDVGITGACTRLTLCVSDYGAGEMQVYGSQFWNPAGYMMNTGGTGSASITKEEAIEYSELLYGSKSFTNTLFNTLTNVFGQTPTAGVTQSQPATFLCTKAFRRSGVGSPIREVFYPMVGLAVTNGAPTTSETLANIAYKSDIYVALDGPSFPNALNADIQRYTVQNQPSKHPMGVIACPETVAGGLERLRAVARFGVDLMVECEDVFPFSWGADINYESQSNQNLASRWYAPGLQLVNETQRTGQVLFSYKSRLISGVQRKVGYDRLTNDGYGGTVFSDSASNAYGGEEVVLSLNDTVLTAIPQSSQTYFSGGYFGYFDGLYNGESDAHSSPGRPQVHLLSPAQGYFPQEALEDPTAAYNAGTNPEISKFGSGYVTGSSTLESVRTTICLVYAILDEDGKFHRSAPSPAVTVDRNKFVNGFGGMAVVLRYLMPPPSAFEGLGDKTLYLEVYAKVDNKRTTDHTTPPYNGAILSVSEFTLIDRFIPELTQNISKYQNLLTAGPNLAGSVVSPFDHTPTSDTRSGFRFFGERILFRPKYIATTESSITDRYRVDDGQFLDMQIYTAGGVLENDPPPSFLDVATANGRIWGIPSNYRSSVWFSKLIAKGKPPEWSAAFTLDLPRGSDKLTAIASLDDKVIMFSESDVFVTYGDGPNNLGRGASLAKPRKVSVDVGCVNRHSVVEGPFGVMFQSKKGIYVLGRDMNISYIGDKVEDQVDSSTITSGILVEKKNQVRYTLSGQSRYKALVYNYYSGIWMVSETEATSVVYPAVSSAIHNDKHTTLSTTNVISKDNGFYDGNTGTQEPIVSKFTTAWVKLAGLQGFKRVKRVFFLGQHLGGKVSLSAQYNYNESVSTTKSWTNAEIVALSTDPMQLGIHIARQKCESIRFVYSDEDAGAAASAGDVISSITIQFGAKNGMFKMSEGSKK